jgi:hypothetical protein
MQKKTLNAVLIIVLMASLVASCVSVDAKNSVPYLFSGGMNGNPLGEIREYDPYNLSLKKNNSFTSTGTLTIASFSDENFIYSSVKAGGLYLVQKRWMTNLSLVCQSGDYGGTINSVLVDDTYVYAGGVTTTKIYQYWKSNLTKKAESLTYGGIITSMVQDDTYIYVGGATTKKVIQYWKTNLTMRAQTVTLADLLINALAINGTYLYAAGQSSSYNIPQIWTTNMTIRMNLTCVSNVLSIIADDTYITYVVSSAPGFLERAWVSNMTATPIYYYGITGMYGLSLTMSDTYLYGSSLDPFNYANNDLFIVWRTNLTEKAHILVGDHVSYELIYDGIVIEPPVLTATASSTPSGRLINVSWTKGDAADKTIIRGSTTAYPLSPTTGTAIYNGTGTYVVQTSLPPSQTWYYRAWSWNDTVDLISTDNSTATATTPVNTAPTIGVYTPTCLSFNVSVDTLAISAYVSDPESDYPLSWIIVCSNGDFSIGGGTAGNKTCAITAPLNYLTTYTWYINVSDSYGAWRNTSCSFLTELPPYVCNLPQLDDYDISQWGTAAWVYVLGSWFWGGFFGVLGAALYIKTENAVVSMMWFLSVGVITMAVWPIDMVYMIGIIAGIVIGCLFAALIINR